MKNLINYLSKKSLSLGNGSGMTRKWFGNDSGMTRFSLASLICLCMLTVGVGDVWGATGSYSLSGTQFGNSNVSAYSTNVTNLTGSSSSTWTVTGYGVDATNHILTIGKGGANYLQTPSCPDNITSVVVTWSGNTSYYLALQTTAGVELEAKSNPSTSTEATFTVSGNYTQLRLVGRRSEGSSNAAAAITSVTVNYGSAEPHTVRFYKTDGMYTDLTEASTGAGVTPPTMQATCDDWTFQGWSLSESDDDESTDELTKVTITDGKYYPSNDVTLYPVYTREGIIESEVSDEITQSTTDLATSGSTGYTAWSNKTETSDAVYAGQSNKGVAFLQLRNSSPSGIISTSSGGVLKKVIVAWKTSGTPSNTAGRYVTIFGKTSAYSDCANLYDNSKKGTSLGSITYGTSTELDNLNEDNDYGYVGILASAAVYINTITITWLVEEDVTYYYSYPSCCTALGSVTGIIGTNTPTSVTLTWSAVSGAEKYQVKVPGSSSHNDWTDAVSGVSVTKSCGTAYTAYFRAIDTNGSHCSEGPESTLAIPAVSWTVTSTGVTHATASPTIPSTTCSGFSTTISPATGYALPAEITVTNASKSWNSSTGALTISSVTGNVSITITPTCVSPVIGTDPADADYYVGDSPDALSVSATLASGTLTYLWKVSTNGGSTWSDATGTNNTASYSGASLSTASTGTIKFKCIVGNSQGGCTVESGVATITINAASSWKLKGSWDSWEEHTMIEDAGVASYSISLDADSRFEFGFDDGSFYKNNGTIITTTSGWVFNTTDNNCHIHTGPAGTYTFAINTSTKAVTVTYPTVSHPNEHYVYFKNTNVWGTVYGYLANSGNDNKAAAWPGSVMQPTTTICGETYHYAALNAMSGTYNTIIFNNGNTGYGNQTSDLSTTGSLGKYNANQDASWHQFKYSISFAGNGNTDGSMSSITELCPGSNQALTSNAFTKDHYTFTGWHADVDVKVGESTIDAGEIIDDEVTIKDIQSDINLTAQWTPNTYTITKTLTNVANAGLPVSFTYTGAATTALNSTFTVDATNFFLPSSITVTMGGTPLTKDTHYTYNNSTGAFTFTAVITGNIVITATATAKLKSIAITTQPTTRKYFAGENFSSTGAVVTATMGDGNTKTVSATWTPSGALSAGTSQTVTASYSEGGIDQTATTTIDVYSVTVNKKNEDGDAVSADGVTAGWTVGTKALAASATSASKYVFKEWQVTGATAASTSSANTTLSSPTANVVVNAVFWKPRTVKWSVNGNDSYNTGSPTTTVVYNGTISTVPTDPSGLACAGTFVAWTDAAHNNGTTDKDDDSYYGAALYSAAGDFPSITAATTTFYAVFAEKTNSDGYKYIGDDGTLTDGKKYIFVNAKSAGSAYALKATDLAAPNSGNNGTAVSVTVTSNAEGVLVTTINTALEFEYVSSGTKLKYEVDGPATRYLFINGDGVGMKSDDSRSRYTTDAGLQGWNNKVTTYYDVYYNSTNEKFEKKESAGSRVYAFIKQTATYGNYVTECDPNIVSVTYDANGGATSCANTTTDKTEDYTVCSTPPTRDYYTFAGWLCSADSKTYAANATISAAAIDADFTLTAQWTPVPYDITYELDGGTNSGSNPAIYNVTTSTITLQDPTKGNDRFEGWYDNGSFTGDAITSIPLGSHGDITLYAKWTERHEIIFDADGATTTIYRADDEDLSASVAGQGNVPSDPDAPTACSSKVFVGWSESTIDDETDDEPADLMKPAAGTVNADKHYYAVWATRESTSGPVTVFEDALYGKAEDNATFSTYGNWDSFGYVYGCGTSAEGVRVSSKDNGGHLQLKANIGLASVDTIKFKIKSYGDTNGGKITLSSYSGAGTYDNAASAEFTTTNTSSWEEKTCILRNADNTTDIRFEGEGSKYRIYLKDIKITKAGTVYTYSAYSTSCCATKVTLSENSPEHGTIVFGKTSVGTCGGDKEVSLTITPAAGYQLATYSVATGDGEVATKNDPGIELNNNSSAAQNITLTFAEDANGAYDVTASFSLMTVTSWAWTLNSAAIPDPLNLYVGQSARLDVAYTPAGVDASKKTYTRNKDNAYINWVGSAYAGYSTISGKASTGENTTPVTFTHADGPSTTVNVKVLPLPLTHFEDLVHGKAFADVVATISDNALSATKTTPTSDDWTTPNANTCEENHLHLVGWIREDWPALVTYLNGGAQPTTTAIVGAGNDGEGHAYYIAAGASINVQIFNGKTFYAVWAKVE